MEQLSEFMPNQANSQAYSEQRLIQPLKQVRSQFQADSQGLIPAYSQGNSTNHNMANSRATWRVKVIGEWQLVTLQAGQEQSRKVSQVDVKGNHKACHARYTGKSLI